jgi:hypothetical protein
MAKCSRCGSEVELFAQITYPLGEIGETSADGVTEVNIAPGRTATLCGSCLSFVQAAIEGRPVFSRGIERVWIRNYIVGPEDAPALGTPGRSGSIKP